MAGRAQAFSDPTVIKLASERFVPVAENSSELQRRRDPDDAKGVFFREIVERGHYGGRTHPTNTRQGSYAFTTGGEFLASVNTRDPQGMAEMLRTALERWERLRGANGASAPADDTNGHGRSSYPADGLVLQVAARDLPREVDTRPEDWRKVAWNLDYAWFTRDEARSLVPEPRVPGSRRAAPWAVCRRIARFHLRDFVRGEPFTWPEDAIRHAELESEIVEVSGDQVRLALRGAVRLAWEAHWVRPEDGEERRYDSGFDATLEGEATWDEAKGAFTAFDLLATGPRWGANQYNNREDDLGPAPMGIAFGLAGSMPSERTPPHTLRTWTAGGGSASASRVAVSGQDYFGETPLKDA